MANKFLFVGNRRFVLEEMVRANLDLAGVFVAAGTHLERDVNSGMFQGLKNLKIFSSKKELIELVKNSQFDIFISNGCPYILPLDELPSAKYINIHPSCLPDLRGADPAIGAVLLRRDGGATCHVIDSGVDTGPIVSQERIPYTSDLDVTTLYQLSFVAEKKVFKDALRLNFMAQFEQTNRVGLTYYTRKFADRVITFLEANDVIINKIKAFNNSSIGAEFAVADFVYKVYSAEIMINEYLRNYVMGFPEHVVALSYEGCIVFHKDGEVIRFKNIWTSSAQPVMVGTNLLNI